MYTSVNEATKVLDNMTLDPLERESAAHFLAHQDDTDAIARLVEALDDVHFGVRWAAAVGLAERGEEVIVPVLRALSTRASSSWMREGVYHIVHYNSSHRVREHAAALLKALKGPGADIAAPVEALHLLDALTKQDA